MATKYLVSVDSGTQSTRVMIFDTQGNRVATGSAQHPEMISPRQGWHEHGKDDSWNALCTASQKAFAQFRGNPEDVVGIGLSSQRICVNIVDKDGQLLHNPISWMDSRWKMNYASLGKLPEDIQDPAYRFFMPYFSIANWMKFNQPGIYEKAHKYLNVAGYLGHNLTGQYRDSISNNIGWPYDVVGWTGLVKDEYIELMGLRRDQLVEVVLPGGHVGDITPEAAAKTGMPAGCPVYACAGDKQCELLGVGAVQEGQAYITLGTLSGLDVVSTKYTPSPTFSYSTYLSAYPKNYNYEAFLGKGFWLVSWFRENFGMDLAQEAESKGISIEEMLNREAEQIPAGAEGLVVLPDWASAKTRPYSKGMIIGFDDRHGRAHMYRALIEGIVMEIKSQTDAMVQGLGVEIKELYVGGGGSKARFCVQAIADAFNMPVRCTREPENTSLGAAICAAVGSGVYIDFDDAIAHMAKEFDIYEPIAENYEMYRFLREEVLTKLYPAMEDVMKNLVEKTADKK